MGNKKDVGSRIKKFRKLKGLTQTELAEKIGKTLSSVQKYENGIIEVPINVLDQIAGELDVPFVTLVATSLDGFEEAAKEKNDQHILKEILNSIGYDIQLNANTEDFSLIHNNGFVTVSKEELTALINSTKDYLDFNTKKLVQEKLF